jgi:hypothetical protein
MHQQGVAGFRDGPRCIPADSVGTGATYPDGFLNRVRWFDSGRGHEPRSRSGSGLGTASVVSGDAIEALRLLVVY